MWHYQRHLFRYISNSNLEKTYLLESFKKFKCTNKYKYKYHGWDMQDAVLSKTKIFDYTFAICVLQVEIWIGNWNYDWESGGIVTSFILLDLYWAKVVIWINLKILLSNSCFSISWLVFYRLQLKVTILKNYNF